MRPPLARCDSLKKHRQYTERPPAVNNKSALPSGRVRRFWQAAGPPGNRPRGSQGRHGATAVAKGKMAGLTGLEPATSCVTGRRSNQLNYDPAPYMQGVGV